MTAQPCPHCSAPIRAGGRPTCLCAAVGAEDFDPLRIRPYVSLADQDGGEGERDAPPDPVPYGLAPGPEDGPGPVVPPAAPRPRRSGPTSRTFTSSEDAPAAPVAPAGSRKRALPALLAATGAAVAATAVLIGGDLLSGGERDRAAPPDRGTVAPTADLPTPEEPRPSATAAPSGPAVSHSPTRHPSSRPAAQTTVPPYRTPPPPTHASGRVGHSPGGPPSAAPTGPIVLREGSGGPEVAELQHRLRQLGRYPDAADGRYDADVREAVARYQEAYGVTGDPYGVYGEPTRASLESQTQEP